MVDSDGDHLLSGQNETAPVSNNGATQAITIESSGETFNSAGSSVNDEDGTEYQPSTENSSDDSISSSEVVFDSFAEELAGANSTIVDVDDESAELPERTAFSFVVKSAEVGDPMSIKSAMARSDANLWKLAMKSEYDSLLENSTWELVDRRPIDSKWVFKTKRDSTNKIIRHKARLVIKGCAQRKGIDYAETYAPVVRYTSIRYLMSMAAKFDLQIDQMDAVTAFLQGDINEKSTCSNRKVFLMAPAKCVV